MRKNAYLAAPWLFTVVIAGCANDNPANSPQNTAAMQNVGETPPAATSTNTADMTGTTAAQPPSTVTGTPTSTGLPSTDNPGSTSTSPNGTTSTASAAATPLTDDQIVEVVHTADVAELEQARLAQSKAQSGHVKKFAAMMMKDHTDAEAKAMTIAKNDKLDMSSSPASTSLASDAQKSTSSLQGQTGASFDKSYIDTQCKEHQALLDLIDQTLLPDAKSTDVKDFLATVRAKVAQHLQRAEDIQKSMQ